jgi:glycosyltransferase involved in cell wall biosynthesis
VARIVGVLCTYNEEHRIADSLGSLIGWCDEVLVVDQHSTDRTREIAASMGARVELHERVGLPEPARDWARDHVDADWVLFLDADELIPSTLAAYLRRHLAADAPFDVLLVPRANIELGRWLRSADSWPSRKARVARPQALEITTRIHRGMRPRPGMRVARLPADKALAIWHFHHVDLETMVANVNRYTTIELEQTAAKKIRRPSAFELVTRPVRWLWRFYVLQQGYRDGRAGLVVAVTRAYYHFLVVAKRWDRVVAAERAPALAAARARILEGHRHPDAADARAAALPAPVAAVGPVAGD